MSNLNLSGAKGKLKPSDFSYNNIIIDSKGNEKLKEGQYEEMSYRDLKFTSVSFKFLHDSKKHRCKFFDKDMNTLEVKDLPRSAFFQMLPNISWTKLYRFPNGYLNCSKRLVSQTSLAK